MPNISRKVKNSKKHPHPSRKAEMGVFIYTVIRLSEVKRGGAGLPGWRAYRAEVRPVYA